MKDSHAFAHPFDSSRAKCSENLYEYDAGTGDYNSPYLPAGRHGRFNPPLGLAEIRAGGKELDPETGNYYYGARYYDPKISVWLSVDPLAHKYPSLSPYVFTGNNPIMLVDPDGRDIKPINKRAESGLVSAFLSFGSKEAVGKTFGLVTAAGSESTYSSRYLLNDFKNERQFKRHAKKQGINLKGDRLSEAYSLFKSLADQKTLEVSIIEGGDGSYAYDNESKKGSTVSSGDRKNAPKTLNDRIIEFEESTSGNITQHDLDNLLEEGNYFENQGNSQSTKGHVIIDGGGNNTQQDGQKIIDVITNQVPDSND